MIIGIGIDVVDINRFAHWHEYSHKQLQRVFSANEIMYCLEIHQKSAERFAARFAAREALFKALCQAWPEHNMAFLTFCRAVEVAHSERGAPYFIIAEECFAKHVPDWHSCAPKILLSLSHTRETATAFTIISSTDL